MPCECNKLLRITESSECKNLPSDYCGCTLRYAGINLVGSLQSLDWNGGMEWWNGIVECVLQGDRFPAAQQFFSSRR